MNRWFKFSRGRRKTKTRIMFRQLRCRFLRTHLKKIGFMCLFVFAFLRYLLTPPTEIYIPSGYDLDKYPPFEPEVLTDFNDGDEGVPKIQRIIHQTWKNERIPPHYVESIKTFVRNNPTWEYYLWTDDSARELIKDHYSWLLPVWDGVSYSKYTIRRADALRYVVLYHYGGLYADLDAICYRSLDNSITKHPCVLTPEPYEHAVFRARVPYLINNAVMMCAAHHPFMKQLMANLHKKEHYDGIIDPTGPGYVTTEYKLYNDLPRESNHLILYNNRSLKDLTDDSPYFFQGNLPKSDNRSIYVANTRYFIHSLDERAFGQLYRDCKKFPQLNHLQRRACANAKRVGLARAPNKYAFVDHQWQLSWIGWKKFMEVFDFMKTDYSIHIRDIVPHCKIYKKF